MNTHRPVVSIFLEVHSARCAVLSHFSHVQLFETLGTVAHQAPSVHGILQAIILEWLLLPCSRVAFQPRDQTRVSCTSRWILYHSATWEAHILFTKKQIPNQHCHQFALNKQSMQPLQNK